MNKQAQIEELKQQLAEVTLYAKKLEERYKKDQATIKATRNALDRIKADNVSLIDLSSRFVEEIKEKDIEISSLKTTRDFWRNRASERAELFGEVTKLAERIGEVNAQA